MISHPTPCHTLTLFTPTTENQDMYINKYMHISGAVMKPEDGRVGSSEWFNNVAPTAKGESTNTPGRLACGQATIKTHGICS